MTASTRTVEDIYPDLSWAIHRARVAEARGERESAMAIQSDISRMEEEVAALLPADNMEGETARRGVLRAALVAMEHSRVLAMAAKYLAEEKLRPAVRRELETIRDAAKAAEAKE